MQRRPPTRRRERGDVFLLISHPVCCTDQATKPNSLRSATVIERADRPGVQAATRIGPPPLTWGTRRGCDSRGGGVLTPRSVHRAARGQAAARGRRSRCRWTANEVRADSAPRGAWRAYRPSKNHQLDALSRRVGGTPDGRFHRPGISTGSTSASIAASYAQPADRQTGRSAAVERGGGTRSEPCGPVPP